MQNLTGILITTATVFLLCVSSVLAQQSFSPRIFQVGHTFPGEYQQRRSPQSRLAEKAPYATIELEEFESMLNSPVASRQQLPIDPNNGRFDRVELLGELSSQAETPSILLLSANVETKTEEKSQKTKTNGQGTASPDDYEDDYFVRYAANWSVRVDALFLRRSQAKPVPLITNVATGSVVLKSRDLKFRHKTSVPIHLN
jgi:hypothetical protein